MRALIAQIRADMGGSKATLRYIARKKIPGVPHHAKAGNINNALMNEGTNGDFILIFDCDMICRPEILQAVLPHFYKVRHLGVCCHDRACLDWTRRDAVYAMTASAITKTQPSRPDPHPTQRRWRTSSW